MDKVITNEKYMIELDWNIDILECAIIFLKEWDDRTDTFYSKIKKIQQQFDKIDREHYRNCVNFWIKRLKNEDK